MYIVQNLNGVKRLFTAVSSTITQYYSELQAYGRSNRFFRQIHRGGKKRLI